MSYKLLLSVSIGLLSAGGFMFFFVDKKQTEQKQAIFTLISLGLGAVVGTVHRSKGFMLSFFTFAGIVFLCGVAVLIYTAIGPKKKSDPLGLKDELQRDRPKD